MERHKIEEKDWRGRNRLVNKLYKRKTQKKLEEQEEEEK